MNWNETYRRLRRLAGSRLNSITGKTNIKLETIDAEDYIVTVKPGKVKKRKTQELRTIVSKMSLNLPVHVDSVLFGSRSSRSHPETLLANLPNVEWLRIKRRKHLVWVGKDTHRMGTLKESKSAD